MTLNQSETSSNCWSCSNINEQIGGLSYHWSVTITNNQSGNCSNNNNQPISEHVKLWSCSNTNHWSCKNSNQRINEHNRWSWSNTNQLIKSRLIANTVAITCNPQGRPNCWFWNSEHKNWSTASYNQWPCVATNNIIQRIVQCWLWSTVASSNNNQSV